MTDPVPGGARDDPVTDEPVPEADRQEQELPPERDPRGRHPHPPDLPEADAVEQELPADGSADELDQPPVTDADRVEPVDDERVEQG